MSKKTEQLPTTHSIHKQLQQIAERELNNLPELLEQLTPSERVKAVLQILPYTAPKVETCKTSFGEPIGWDIL